MIEIKGWGTKGRERERQRGNIANPMASRTNVLLKSNPFPRSIVRTPWKGNRSLSLSLSLSLLFSFYLGSFLDAWFDCSFTIDRDTSARRCKFLLVRSFVPFDLSPFAANEDEHFFKGIQKNFSQFNRIICFFKKIFQLLKNLGEINIE